MSDNPPATKRKPIPLKVQVIVLKRALCKLLSCEAIEFDHRPPLYLRRDWTIDPNDPDYIEAIPMHEHRKRTHGTKATSYGSDAHERAKVKRLDKQLSSKASRQMLFDLMTISTHLRRARPLPGGKGSPLKKKLSGKVVPR
jgi:hypothetical protein